jgi:hypothetical protein
MLCPYRLTATGRPESRRAVRNCVRAALTGPDGEDPSKEMLCSLGNTSIILSSESSFKAGTIRGVNFLHKDKAFTLENGCRSSSHRVFSTSSCQCRRGYKGSRMSRCSKLEGKRKGELQISVREESCQSDTLHRIVNSTPMRPAVMR